MKTFAEIGGEDSPKTEAAQCAEHGEFVSKNVFGSVWTKCPECAAEKQASDRRDREEQAAIERQRSWEKRLGEAGIPERFQDRSLENYHAKNDGQKRALLFATEFAESFDQVLKTGRSAIFCGKPGTGKTHLAVGVGLYAMACHKLVMFTTVQRMVWRVKDSFRHGSTESEKGVVDLMVQPDLLILDEVGVQYGTEFEKNLMFGILNERYEKRRPTLLLSNLPVAEVKAFLGERVYDRLREDGGKAIAFDWESHRGQA